MEKLFHDNIPVTDNDLTELAAKRAEAVREQLLQDSKVEPAMRMDGHALGLGLAVLGLPMLMLIPTLGGALLLVGALAAGWAWRRTAR